MLHHSLGRIGSGIFLGTGAGIIVCRLGALVHQNEADVALVTAQTGHTGIHIHVVVEGDVVIAVGGDGTALLTENRVEEAVLVLTIIVILLDQQIGGVHPVHPVGDFGRGIVGAFAGDGIHQHGALYVGTAEQTDGLDDTGTDPPGIALLVNFKIGGVKEPGGIAESQMTVEVAAEMIVGGVFHALVQTHHLGGLLHHIHPHIGRQAFFHVVEPLEQVTVAQGCHTDGGILPVDLVIVAGHLELGNHVGQLAQLAAAQTLGRVLVQHGHLVKGNLGNIGGKIAVFDG